MNETVQTPATKVKIIADQAFCETHGWERESVLPTTEPAIDGYKDSKGQNIYVQSVLRGRNVALFSNEYELLEN